MTQRSSAAKSGGKF